MLNLDFEFQSTAILKSFKIILWICFVLIRHSKVLRELDIAFCLVVINFKETTHTDRNEGFFGICLLAIFFFSLMYRMIFQRLVPVPFYGNTLYACIMCIGNTSLTWHTHFSQSQNDSSPENVDHRCIRRNCECEYKTGEFN